MFELEKQVQCWRRSLLGKEKLPLQYVNELESHLRDSLDSFSALPLNQEEQFLLATHRIGDMDSLAKEYDKVLDANKDHDFLPLTYHLENADKLQVYACIHSRFSAFLLDTLLLTLITVVLMLSVADFSLIWQIVALLLLGIMKFNYLVYFTYSFGGTIGNICNGIRVTKADGSQLSLNQTLIRFTPYIILQLITVLAVIHYLSPINPVMIHSPFTHMEIFVLRLHQSWDLVNWSQYATCLFSLLNAGTLLFNKRRRTLMDFLAGTVVIHDRFSQVAFYAEKPFITPSAAIIKI